jgi:diguanylate cyclase (GGDEF)-like protein/PAS domain S-box-containing protein
VISYGYRWYCFFEFGNAVCQVDAENKFANAREATAPIEYKDDYISPDFIVNCFSVQMGPMKKSQSKPLKNLPVTPEGLEDFKDYHRFFNLSTDLLCIAGLDGSFKKVNQSFANFFGLTVEEVLSKNAGDLIHPDDLPKAMVELERMIKGARAISLEARFLSQGGYRWILWSGLPFPDEGVFYAVGKDITDHRQMEEQLLFLSLVDELTGLYNRRGFVMLAEEELKLMRRAGGNTLIFFADMDKLKEVNDNYGHQEGDYAIKKTAEILRQTFREADIVARTGGDEFVILTAYSMPENIESIISRLQAKIDAYNALSSRSYVLSLSIGAIPVDIHSPDSIDELIDKADKAMYEQKRFKQNQENAAQERFIPRMRKSG